MTAKEQIYRELIQPYFEKDAKYIGAEIETILFPLTDDLNNKAAVQKVLKKLIEEKDFKATIIGSDDCIVRISNGIDAVSCDYSYQVFEFSFGKDVSVNSIADRFYGYCSFLQEEFRKLGFMFTGMGTNFFKLSFDSDEQFTHDPFYNQVRRFVADYSSEENVANFYTMMASAQSHIDVKGEQLLTLYNLFNRLDFARALLFSNSIPNKKDDGNYDKFPKNLICTRDYQWSYQPLPNLGIIEKDLSSLDELVDHIAQQKIFADISTGKPVFIVPEKVEDFVAKDNTTATYRSFEHVVINQYHALEVRSDCTQPFYNAFAPLAFNLGIANNWEAAYGILDAFYKKSGLEQNNALLREMAITQKIDMKDPIVKEMLTDLVNVAENGLKSRNLNEEKHLQCLYERIEKGMNPALYMIQELNAGKTPLDIAKEFSSF